MKRAVYCRTRGTASTAMVGLLACGREKPDAAQKGQPSPNQVRLDRTIGFYQTTSMGAL
jgi:hypothetical protein